MMISYTELSEFLATRYGLGHIVRCIACSALYCSTTKIPIIGDLDKHLHCCSSPFTLYMSNADVKISGIFNLDSNLLILGIEFLKEEDQGVNNG